MNFAAKQHLTLIERNETELKAHEDAIAEAELNCKGLMNTELFSRYEQHITKQLTETLDRIGINSGLLQQILPGKEESHALQPWAKSSF